MKIINKKAPVSFKITEKFEAGIVLLGSEVKAIRLGHVDLGSSYVKIIDNEAFLVNAKIFPYKFSRLENYDEGRSRKLLLHKKEITTLKSKLEQKHVTLVPTAIYIKDGHFKLEIALGSGKKAFEMRKDAKRKALDRASERELRTS
jgi:SsrA-binding protein